MSLALLRCNVKIYILQSLRNIIRLQRIEFNFLKSNFPSHVFIKTKAFKFVAFLLDFKLHLGNCLKLHLSH